ncbi:hypothetical protein GH714_035175 [Hevea brasiliensis]|uniref:Alpha-carbonic anhydrase domain-containing protein n=1 Tax=Hevea brasiliensis TaxID=3981 RepID=A0A6A6M837_HEVBR|nr:hypothetical protein GH714_035175 [Hevea brasiliensis]
MLVLIGMLAVFAGFNSSFSFFGDSDFGETPYSYIEATGRGPSKWGQLNPAWTACGNGRRQSPIDLRAQKAESPPTLGDLQTQYEAADTTIVSRGHDIENVRGLTLIMVNQVSWEGNAGNIIIDGDHYNLIQCHWHIPTEHAINGRRYDLELHIVHQNSNGTTAVIGILYKLGQPDPFLSRVREVSVKQVEALRNAVDNVFKMNARPIQALNRRTVYLYNSK